MVLTPSLPVLRRQRRVGLCELQACQEKMAQHLQALAALPGDPHGHSQPFASPVRGIQGPLLVAKGTRVCRQNTHAYKIIQSLKR